MTKELATTTPSSLAPLAAPPPLDRNPAAAYVSSLGSAESRRTMKDALRVAVETFTGEKHATPEARDRSILAFPWHQLRYQHVNTLRAYLAEHYAPASANKMLTAVKQVINECRKLRLMPAEDAIAATKDVKRIKGERARKGRALSPEEIVALRNAAADAPPEIAARDRFMVDLLVYAGLRRDEAASLDLMCIEQDQIRMLGKGNKQRLVPMSAALRASLQAWLQVRTTAPGPLLFKATKEGRLIRGKPLTGATIFARVKRLAAAAGIQTFGPHDCRRTFATTLIARGVPLTTVATLMGHADIATTKKYDMSGEAAAKAAVEKLDY